MACNCNVVTITGNSKVTFNTITTSTSAYTSEDNIGGKIEIENAFRVTGGTVILESIGIWDKDNQKSNLHIDFWNDDPANGTYTDNSAQVIDGDQSYWLGSIDINSSDYITTGTIATASNKILNLILETIPNSTSLFITIKTTSTPTFTSTSGLIIKLGLLRD